MAEPIVRREGNLRFAGAACAGYPEDPLALAAAARSAMRDQSIRCLGPATLLFHVAPHDEPPARWECRVGTAIVGLAKPTAELAIEDFLDLHALILPHAGPIADLPATHRRLVEHARALGARVRPYWRLALARRRQADGNILPAAEVAVFLDR